MGKTLIEGPNKTKEELREWHRQESEGAGVITSADVEAHAETKIRPDGLVSGSAIRGEDGDLAGLGKLSPSHYRGGIECIDAMRQIESPEGFAAHCRLTAFKYLWRAGEKPGQLTSDDLGKAIVYLGWAVESLKEQGR